jgi:hypothetical protein
MSDGDLLEALHDWQLGYAKDDAHGVDATDADRALHDLMLAADPPELDCILYRGQGVPDGMAVDIAAGEHVVIPPTARPFASWSRSAEVARQFMDDAVLDNSEAVLLAVHSSRLRPLADLDALGVQGMNEGEVIVEAGRIAVSLSDVLALYRWDEDAQSCFPVAVPSMIPFAPTLR